MSNNQSHSRRRDESGPEPAHEVSAPGGTDERPDRDLVEAFLRDRNESTFRALYRRQTPALFRFAVLRVGPDLADEVVQETWLRAASGLARFGWRSSLRTWLIGIALNCCREMIRTAARERAHEDPADDAASPVVGAPPGLAMDLRRAIGHLPPRAREVLLMHDVQGFVHREIGEVLGIEPGTSKSQLARARGLLRDQLNKTGVRRHG